MNAQELRYWLPSYCIQNCSNPEIIRNWRHKIYLHMHSLRALFVSLPGWDGDFCNVIWWGRKPNDFCNILHTITELSALLKTKNGTKIKSQIYPLKFIYATNSAPPNKMPCPTHWKDTYIRVKWFKHIFCVRQCTACLCWVQCVWQWRCGCKHTLNSTTYTVLKYSNFAPVADSNTMIFKMKIRAPVWLASKCGFAIWLVHTSQSNRFNRTILSRRVVNAKTKVIKKFKKSWCTWWTCLK